MYIAEKGEPGSALRERRRRGWTTEPMLCAGLCQAGATHYMVDGGTIRRQGLDHRESGISLSA